MYLMRLKHHVMIRTVDADWIITLQGRLWKFHVCIIFTLIPYANHHS